MAAIHSKALIVMLLLPPMCEEGYLRLSGAFRVWLFLVWEERGDC